MSKMSDMAMAIENLRKCAATINEAANWIAEVFGSDESTPPKVDHPPIEPALTLEAVRAILADKSRAGYTAQIRSLLQKYGASKLSEVDPYNYKSLIADVEELTYAT